MIITALLSVLRSQPQTNLSIKYATVKKQYVCRYNIAIQITMGCSQENVFTFFSQTAHTIKHSQQICFTTLIVGIM